MFAQIPTEQIVQGFGWQAGLVIVGLITALLYVIRQNDNKQKKIDSLQDRALERAETVTDNVMQPLKELKDVSDKNYDLLASVIKRGE